MANLFRRRFGADQRGAAVVEFAMIAPIFALGVVMIGDGATLIMRYFDMRAAVSSAGQYVMVGGSEVTVARQVALSAWTTQAPGSTVSVSNSCLCASAPNACNALCPDQSVPLSYTTVQATSSYQGALISMPLSAQQVIRVR
jgi:Flp pilus assembly protein TadG